MTDGTGMFGVGRSRRFRALADRLATRAVNKSGGWDVDGLISDLIEARFENERLWEENANLRAQVTDVAQLKATAEWLEIDLSHDKGQLRVTRRLLRKREAAIQRVLDLCAEGNPLHPTEVVAALNKEEPDE